MCKTLILFISLVLVPALAGSASAVETASNPSPSDGATNVAPSVVLSWTPGDYAASHDVYFGTDYDDVNDATTVSPEHMGSVGPNQFALPALDMDRTYYWRIDEANNAHPNSPWKGDVWSFTTAPYLIVDDMESYNKTDNPIYYTWDDGWINWNGSEVTLGIDPCDPVHGGKQSMVYYYDNGDSIGWDLDYYSEIEADTADLQAGSDWTAGGVQYLVLWFYGNPGNDANATEQLYVGLEDTTGAGSYAQVDYADMSDIQVAEWQVWNIALTDFVGLDLANVSKIYIGFGIRGNPNPGGTPGGSGTVYFDDIWLSQRAMEDMLVFSQCDFLLDGTSYYNTEWGSLDFTYFGRPEMMYLNVTVNGSWQVQNIPVLSREGDWVEQTLTYSFDLGTPRGTDVCDVTCGYDFTSYPLATMPPEDRTAFVDDRYIEIDSGVDGYPIPALAPADALVGGKAVAPKKAGHKNFPNQECGKQECAPAAVSNSLQFLNNKHKLGMPPNKITIEEMKKATGFVAGRGCPVNLWELKKKYMQKNGYPITTRKITDLSKLAAEIKDGQDVELVGGWHMAAVVSITALDDGKYAIEVAHDTNQGNPGGTKTETITYDPKTKRFKGSPGFFNGSIFRYAVVECPKRKFPPFWFLDCRLKLVRTDRWITIPTGFWGGWWWWHHQCHWFRPWHGPVSWHKPYCRYWYHVYWPHWPWYRHYRPWWHYWRWRGWPWFWGFKDCLTFRYSYYRPHIIYWWSWYWPRGLQGNCFELVTMSNEDDPGGGRILPLHQDVVSNLEVQSHEFSINGGAVEGDFSELEYIQVSQLESYYSGLPGVEDVDVQNLMDSEIIQQLMTNDPSGEGYVGVQRAQWDHPEPALAVTDESFEIDEGGVHDYNVALPSEPCSPVTVNVFSSDPEDLQIQDADPNGELQLYFDDSNWAEPQTVRVEAVDDGSSEGEENVVITHSFSDDPNTGVPLQITINDNECGGSGYSEADTNRDCIVNYKDFAVIADVWLASTDPMEMHP
jgi:hypothetical protein